MTESIDQRIQSLDPEALNSINSYIDELKSEAKGDFDFITKFLKQQFQTALGSDDPARAKFLADVANQVEKRIGRIPFDYDQKTGREKEDITNTLRRLDIEDTDLRAREIEFEQQQKFATGLEKEQRQGEFNQRGLLGSGLEAKRAQQQAEARRLETDPMRRALSLEATQRGEQRQEAQLQSGRRMEDLTTTARRGAEDETLGFQKGTEGAQLSLDQRLADIRRVGAAEKRSVLGSLQGEELFKRQTAQFE